MFLFAHQTVTKQEQLVNILLVFLTKRNKVLPVFCPDPKALGGTGLVGSILASRTAVEDILGL